MNVELGQRPGNFFSGNICFEFSVLCLCSVVSVDSRLDNVKLLLHYHSYTVYRPSRTPASISWYTHRRAMYLQFGCLSSFPFITLSPSSPPPPTSVIKMHSSLFCMAGWLLDTGQCGPGNCMNQLPSCRKLLTTSWYESASFLSDSIDKMTCWLLDGIWISAFQS